MCAQEEYNIPDDLIINFNHTLLAYICGYNNTMEFEGTTSVSVVGKGKKNKKKQQITVPFTGTKTGLFLPMQLIYKGKTTHSLLK